MIVGNSELDAKSSPRASRRFSVLSAAGDAHHADFVNPSWLKPVAPGGDSGATVGGQLPASRRVDFYRLMAIWIRSFYTAGLLLLVAHLRFSFYRS